MKVNGRCAFDFNVAMRIEDMKTKAVVSGSFQQFIDDLLNVVGLPHSCVAKQTNMRIYDTRGVPGNRGSIHGIFPPLDLHYWRPVWWQSVAISAPAPCPARRSRRDHVRS